MLSPQSFDHYKSMLAILRAVVIQIVEVDGWGGGGGRLFNMVIIVVSDWVSDQVTRI